MFRRSHARQEDALARADAYLLSNSKAISALKKKKKKLCCQAQASAKAPLQDIMQNRDTNRVILADFVTEQEN